MTSRSGNGRDIQLALVLAVTVLAAIAASLIRQFDPPAALHSIVALSAIALCATTITAALVRQRLIAVRRGLSSRTHLSVVPADGFATDPESVLRFASQLASTEPLVAGRLGRPAAAIRVRLGHDDDGRLTYSLGVPAETTRRRSPREAIAHLKTLDEAILAALGDRLAEPESAAESRGAYSSGAKIDEAGS